MSSAVVSKSGQTAYQRWEIGAITAADIAQPGPEVATPEELAAQAEELRLVREQARQEGYAEGRAAGHAEGKAAALAEGRASNAINSNALERLIASFEAQLAHADEGIADQVFDLSVHLAEAVVRGTVDVRPDLVIPIVKQAISSLPGMQSGGTITANPADAVLLQPFIDESLAGMNWQILVDPVVERGGCRVSTSSNQVDATLHARWRKVLATLATDTSWIAAKN